VSYRLTDALTIEMVAEAQVDAPCPVGLTNHAYFNLDATHGDVRQHRLRIVAHDYVPVDSELIPLGGPVPVGGTSLDFREAKPITQHWLADEQQRAGGGYDHAFLLDAACAQAQSPAAVLSAADASLRLEISTSLPALQFYAGQLLAGTPSRNGVPYAACAGIALEPEFLPDSPNHPEWPQPSCWLQPGQRYRHTIRWRFVPG
jgi:aldose 1-epimerase